MQTEKNAGVNQPNTSTARPPSPGGSGVASQCQHKFVYHRQESKNIGFDRNPVYVVEDVFFCEHCLTFRRVAIEKRTPRHDSYGEHVERLV